MILNTASDVMIGGSQVSKIMQGGNVVWQRAGGLPTPGSTHHWWGKGLADQTLTSSVAGAGDTPFDWMDGSPEVVNENIVFTIPAKQFMYAQWQPSYQNPAVHMRFIFPTISNNLQILKFSDKAWAQSFWITLMADGRVSVTNNDGSVYWDTTTPGGTNLTSGESYDLIVQRFGNGELTMKVLNAAGDAENRIADKIPVGPVAAELFNFGTMWGDVGGQFQVVGVELSTDINDFIK